MRGSQNREEYRGLQTHTEESFWEVNSLIACALVRRGVAWCRSQASLSKRAQSTTLTSLRLESTICRRSESHYRKRPLQILAFPNAICIQRFTAGAQQLVAAIV